MRTASAWHTHPRALDWAQATSENNGTYAKLPAFKAPWGTDKEIAIGRKRPYTPWDEQAPFPPNENVDVHDIVGSDGMESLRVVWKSLEKCMGEWVRGCIGVYVG